MTTPVLWSPGLVRIVLAQLAFGFSWCLYLVAPKFLTTELSVGPGGIGSVRRRLRLRARRALPDPDRARE